MLFVLHIHRNGLHARYFAGFQSASADVDTFRLAVYQNPNFLYVYAPSASIFIIRVRHVISASRFFACYIAFARHIVTPPCMKTLHKTILKYNSIAKKASSTQIKTLFIYPLSYSTMLISP